MAGSSAAVRQLTNWCRDYLISSKNHYKPPATICVQPLRYSSVPDTTNWRFQKQRAPYVITKPSSQVQAVHNILSSRSTLTETLFLDHPPTSHRKLEWIIGWLAACAMTEQITGKSCYPIPQLGAPKRRLRPSATCSYITSPTLIQH